MSPSRASSTRHQSARVRRWNGVLTALLLLVLVFEINHLAAQHLHLRRDLSEDQLYALSDATRATLARLEDKLLVKTYFTGDVRSGDVALAKAHILAELDDLANLGKPWVEVVHVDPSTSTAALEDTRSYGIEPQRIAVSQGTQWIDQPVYLGLLLRYRGREEVIRWADPWGFEVQFTSAVHSLESEHIPRIGWYEHVEAKVRQTDVGFSSYEMARNLVGRRAELISIPDLRDGDPKGLLDDLDLLIVVRPREEHPRAAFELEQYVRGGGRMLLCVDQADYNILLRSARPASDGSPPPRTLGALEKVLYTWRAMPSPAVHAWDMEGQSDFQWVQFDDAGRATPQPGRSPAIISLGRDGFNRTHPITAGMQRATLSWAQPIEPGDPPPGVRRVDLLFTSSDSYVDEIRPAFAALPEQVEAVKEKLLAGEAEPRMPLAAVFTGVFPAVFDQAPAPFDPLLDEKAAAPARTCDDPVLPEGTPARVVLIGDADWLRDDRPRGLLPGITAPGNQVLLMNIVDWLAQGEELIELRNKVPRDRSLRNFEKEAELELGVYQSKLPDSDEEARQQRELRDRARARARREEWRRMLFPMLVSLGLVLAFGLVWNLRERGRGEA